MIPVIPNARQKSSNFRSKPLCQNSLAVDNPVDNLWITPRNSVDKCVDK